MTTTDEAIGATSTPSGTVEAGTRGVASPVSPWLLRSIVLVAGMTTMATEMSASRLLSPWFGASVLVWANIIGLVLIYLSIGYWIGGRIADRHPHLRGLCTVTLAAAASIAVVPFIAAPILRASAGSIDSAAVGTVLGSFGGTLLLFAVPITLLGMVPPYAVRLAITNVEESGRAAGNLYSLSTIGSIIGTFGAVLLFIPAIGTRRTMLVFALLLAALSLVGLWRARRLPAVAAVAVIGVLLALAEGGVAKPAEGMRVLDERESPYQYIQVNEDPDSGRRVLQLNEGWAVHSVYDPRTVMTGDIWDTFVVLPALVRPAEHMPAGAPADTSRETRVLIIGNAAGSAARIFDELRPAAKLDGVEIDPVVSEMGRRWFHMDDARSLTVHEADGRPFLARSGDTTWDYIHIDAFRQPYIPFYLTTKEFFAEVEQHLAPGGVVSINVGATPGDDRVLDAIAATMRDVFPTVVTAPVREYNSLVIATKEPTDTAAMRQAIAASPLSTDPRTADVAGWITDRLETVEPDADAVLTDDHAPVEWMTDRMIIGEASG